jgi:hypothetical protein
MTDRYRHTISSSSRLSMLKDKGYTLLSLVSEYQRPGSILPISIELQKCEFIKEPWYSTRLEPECRSEFDKTNCVQALKKSFKHLVQTKILLNRVKSECNPYYLSNFEPFVPYACKRARLIAAEPCFFFHCSRCTSLILYHLSSNPILAAESTLNHCDLHASNFIDSISPQESRSGWIDLENVCMAPYFTDLLQYFFIYKNASLHAVEDISLLTQDAGRCPDQADMLVAIALVLIHWRELADSGNDIIASSMEVSFHEATSRMKAIVAWQRLFESST